MPEYFIHFALAHNEFRIPELLSICELLDVNIELPADPAERDLNRPFMVVKLENDEAAKKIASRCILVKAIYALWAHSTTYASLHEINRANSHLWMQYQPSASFKFVVDSIHHRIPQKRIRETIQSFSYMAWKGPIDMKNPEVVLTCLEEYSGPDPSAKRSEHDGEFIHLYFGRLLSEEGATRHLVTKFDVKQRVFYGNTSMDAEVSLLMANQAQAAPGKLVYDPFAGTGSMLYTAAHFGAFVVGSDLDGRQMRGKNATSSGTLRAATQYGVAHRLVDSLTFDVTRNPWRCGELFDAIVTDPPYGVRAGAKRLGGKKKNGELREEPIVLEDGQLAHTKPTYVPPTKPYELSDLAQDLVHFAAYMLKPGGRLVFFLPTVTDEYQDVDIPRAEGMELVANSLQDFGKWGRRLITMVKTADKPVDPPRFLGAEDAPSEGGIKSDTVPAHKNFRVKYFQGFQTGGSDSVSGAEDNKPATGDGGASTTTSTTNP
ncbi:tRNA guanosine-2'-O-methyltransferase [Clavulina sp. PMI_390]|nr:tRNA guanosine-2'-O-methyltransferase [Clavulina sp. PMI_390]